jgi:hypothetical protein
MLYNVYMSETEKSPEAERARERAKQRSAEIEKATNKEINTRRHEIEKSPAAAISCHRRKAGCFCIEYGSLQEGNREGVRTR